MNSKIEERVEELQETHLKTIDFDIDKCTDYIVKDLEDTILSIGNRVYRLFEDDNKVEECFTVLYSFKSEEDVVNFVRNPLTAISMKMMIVKMTMIEFGC